MHQRTFGADPASILFNLPGYRVISVSPGLEGNLREVLVEAVDVEGACPACGVLSSRVQARPTQHVKDVACGGERIDVTVRKRRYRCIESRCTRVTFTEQTDRLPARARVTTRLSEQVITACRAEPRAVSRVADEAGLTWPTVMRLLTSTIDLVTAVDTRHVQRLGIDEHRFRTVRYLRDPDTHAITRVEPWFDRVHRPRHRRAARCRRRPPRRDGHRVAGRPAAVVAPTGPAGRDRHER